MTPSNELDALVAQKVMGWKEINLNDSGIPFDKNSHNFYPSYSTDISAAWEVIEKLFLITPRWQIKIKNWIQGYTVQFKREDHITAYQQADTAPLAICLAALKVMGVEVK